ncbi:Fur family transcriptional regulator [Gracilibacillus alcaliphilus]|uniref:Fur family transcriptional regulator n=1 Tax=Gracilibacillus alcaliphilus TaxID=1401441 RepID=UPI00195C5991|nr:transcriptional repressor [Gracilibacillus alcaliphilus]MBM7678754.1 Fur family ferric uptake transcriptional regulator [Gracilibacillus alcaliphilus]
MRSWIRTAPENSMKSQRVSEPQPYKEPLKASMKRVGIKWTKQRAVIINVFEAKGAGLMTAEDVFWAAKIKYPALGIATVYRTLELCVEARLLRRVFNDRTARYCYCPYDMKKSCSASYCRH